MALKLSSLKASESSIVVLKHPVTGEDLVDDKGGEVAVEVFGKASKVHQDYMNSVLKKAIEKNKVANKVKQQDITVEKIKDDEIGFLVAMTKRFVNLVDDDGKEINTPESIKAIYENTDYYFVKEQVNAALENDSNFFKP